jgi:hypothetical protein
MAKPAEWTVLIFLNAKNNLEPFAFSNFLQMSSIGSTDEVNLVVEMGRPAQHYSDDYGAWSKTLRFRITKGQDPIEANAVQDLGATNMGDPSSLARFVAWGRETYPAKHTMLVIWDHGQGWRVPEIRAAGLPPRPRPAPASYRYVSNDDDTGDKLYNRGIQDALTTLLAGQRLDIIAFDACLMAMIETAYAMRGVAEVMVGSEELEPGDGWNYTKWIQPLVDQKGAVSAIDVGKSLVRGMAAQYGDAVETTLSAILLDAVPAVAVMVSTFAALAVSLVTPATIAAFKAARGACANYAPGYGLNSIDLAHFMEQIVAGDFDASLKSAAQGVLGTVHAAVLDHHASASRQGKFGSQGLAIYYPATATAHSTDPDGDGYRVGNIKYPVEFVDKEQWVTFLTKYWSLVP